MCNKSRMIDEKNKKGERRKSEDAEGMWSEGTKIGG